MPGARMHEATDLCTRAAVIGDNDDLLADMLSAL